MGYAAVAQQALKAHGFRFTHSLGQNFLFDEQVIEEIADAACIAAGDRVLEIGAGAGVLTAALSGRGAQVLALEIDETLGPVLAQVLSGCENVTLVFADALKAQLGTLTQSAFGDAPFKVVANLPYYITADILVKLLTVGLPLQSIVVMVQQEACDRVMAQPGQKVYCALAATVQYYGKPEAVFQVAPSAFTPPPHVMSVLMRIDVYADKPVQAQDDQMMRKVINTAFAMRRKTMLNNLIAAFSLKRESAEQLMGEASLPPTVRGEALTLAQLARLADVLGKR